LLSALSGHDEGELLVIMRELIAAQLVVEEQGDRFAFRHALTRESIYAGLLDREKRRLHRRIADAIEQLQISSSDQRLDDLARHAFAACTWPLALEACHRAGMRAAALHAPRAAADHFANAIDAARAVGQPPDAELVRARGRALETLGDFDGARADYDIALAMFRANGNQRDAWQTLLDLALLWSSRDYQRTGEFVAEALAVARELGDPAAVASSLNRAGNWQCNIEEPHRGAKHHREALQIFETLGDERGIAETLDLLGMAGLIGGDQTSGFSAYERAIPVWRRLGDQRGLASALLGLSISCPTFHTSTLPTLRPVGEVRAIGLQSIELCQEIGWRAGECFAKWGFLGMALGACGKYDLAIPGTREALLIAREIEHRQWITGARCILGNLYADLGDLPAARVELEAALALAQEIGSLYWTRSARGWLASILVCANQLDEAETLLHAEPAADVPTTIAGRLLRAAAAEHVLARGNPEEAIAAIDVLVATIPDGTRRTPTRLERLRGEALVALGDYDAALVVLTAAREEASWSGARPQFWRIDAALSRLHLLRGEQDESQRAAIAARMLVADLAMCVPDDVLREALLAVAERELPAIHAPEVVAASDRPGSPLTRREREVAFLLTEGLTNREIGVRLFLSEWTVATHVRNILAKLDLSTRAQIAAWAARQDAAPPA
jgi:DNA-binding CsgD family transcriptional regulator/tetratricopeptide (TPR) repeat protein